MRGTIRRTWARRRRVTAALCGAVVVMAGGGCGPDAPGAVDTGLVPPAVRDSAGVRVVDNRVPERGMPEYATVDAEPSVRLGSASLPDALVGVRGAAVLSDGRIVVAAAADRTLRYYASDGTLQMRAGGEGADRGEFRSISRFGRLGGDTVWVHDAVARTLSVFRPDGSLDRDARAPEGFFVAGRFGDDSYLLVPGWSTALARENPVEGVRRDPARYLRWWPASGDTAGVGTFHHDEMLYVGDDGEGREVFGVPPFGRETVRAVGAGRFYVGEAESFEIRGFDPDGTLRDIIRLEGVDLTLTSAVVARARADGPAWADRYWDAVGDLRPAYSRLLLDRAGHLWVGEHVAGPTPPRNWLVFAPDGAVRGLVRVPSGMRLLEVGPDYVLGLTEDDEGREWVTRHVLRRLR